MLHSKLKHFSTSKYTLHNNVPFRCLITSRVILKKWVWVDELLTRVAKKEDTIMSPIRIFLKDLRVWSDWTRSGIVHTVVRRCKRDRGVREVIQCFRQAFFRPRRSLLISATAAYKARGDDDDNTPSCEKSISDVELQELLKDLEVVETLSQSTLFCCCCGKRLLIDKKQPGVHYCSCKVAQVPDTSEQSDGWVPYMEAEDVIIWRKEYKPGLGLYAYKVYGRYPEVTAADFAAVQVDGAYRRVWDAAVAALAIVERGANGLPDQAVLHWEVLWPRLFANRDYVYIRRHKEFEVASKGQPHTPGLFQEAVLIKERAEPIYTERPSVHSNAKRKAMEAYAMKKDTGDILDNKVYVILSRSCQHPDVPETKHAIRVSEYWSHMVVKTLNGGDKSGMEFVLTYYDEPAVGGMPCSVAAWATGRAAPAYLQRMRRAALDYRDWRHVTQQEIPDFTPFETESTVDDQKDGQPVNEQDMESSQRGPVMENGEGESERRDQGTQTDDSEQKPKVKVTTTEDKSVETEKEMKHEAPPPEVVTPKAVEDEEPKNGEEDLYNNPQPSTSGVKKQTTFDETLSDFSSDDSVADPTFSPDSPSLLPQHEELDFAVPDTSTYEIPSSARYDAHENIEDASLQQRIQSMGTRKRKRENKLKRNLGQAYVTVSGKKVEKREIKELPDCRNKCREKITDEQRAVIHKEVWDLGSYDLRAAFIASLITIQEKRTERRRAEDIEKQKSRQYTYKYHFNINNEKISVCQGCFVRTLSITDNFIKLIGLKKRNSASGIIKTDERGKTTPSNKHTEEKIQEVINHINSFPLYESHYTRRKSNRKYLPSYLTIAKMYSLYSASHQNPVSDKIYRREFHRLNLSFKKPKVDTCHNCDLFKMKINVATDEATKLTIQSERDSHLLAADMAYEEKKLDKSTAATNNKIKCLSFDLQQCLPTPALQSSVAFYKRQLWTFNLTVHDNATGNSTHHMWHEGISGRGANQIASCLFTYLRELPDDITEVILYSDTCGGQNKNTHVAAMFTYLLTLKPSIKYIHHKFMVSGHTHMEVDLDHAIIEKKKKKTEIQIYHPHDWFQLVRSSSKKFTVKEMRQTDFFNFASLLKGPLIARKKDSDGNIFKWHHVKWLCYDADYGVIKYKTSLSRDENFKTINYKRITRRKQKCTLLPITTLPVPISVEKKRDIISLLPLIPECFHNFYQNLVTTADTLDVDPDLQDSDESE